MTTLSSIIKDAYRESNLIAISATPTDLEIAEALQLLNRHINNIIGTELGELLEDANLGLNNVTRQSFNGEWLSDDLAAWYLPENLRVVANLTEAQTVYLHPNPRDGARFGVTDPSENLATYNLTFNGNGRRVEDATSITLNTNGVVREWFYRGDLSNWVRLTNLTVDDESPFPTEYDDLLIIGLAIRLNPRNGVVADPQSIETYKRILKLFKSRYRQSRQVGSETQLALFHPWYRSYGYYSDTNTFDRGRPW
jgi:hypothetical protein